MSKKQERMSERGEGTRIKPTAPGAVPGAEHPRGMKNASDTGGGGGPIRSPLDKGHYDPKNNPRSRP